MIFRAEQARIFFNIQKQSPYKGKHRKNILKKIEKFLDKWTKGLYNTILHYNGVKYPLEKCHSKILAKTLYKM